MESMQKIVYIIVLMKAESFRNLLENKQFISLFNLNKYIKNFGACL